MTNSRSPFLTVAAAIDRPFDQLAGDRRRDQAGLALDIAEIAVALALDAEQPSSGALPVATAGGRWREAPRAMKIALGGLS